jgi:2,6-dihydroxypseudooxynicotine hydrolase
MSDSAEADARQSPATWGYAGRAWRLARRIDHRRLDLYLRARSAAALPGAHARFVAMGLPFEAVDTALRMVRSLDGWAGAWTWLAQRFLGDARQLASAGHEVDAARARTFAALAYHAAQLLVFHDPRKTRALRSSSTTLFSQASPIMMPDLLRVEIPWRAKRLPGYLQRPRLSTEPAPLAVLLNGATTTKEELVGWFGRFLDHGLAVLALDWPGTGEAARTTELTVDCDDLTEGVLALADDHALDRCRVALVGFSLGGAMAVRTAVLDRRIAACVAVTPPFDARGWLPASNELVFEQLAALAGGRERALEVAAEFALPSVVERLRCPLLVVGAGRDLIVPPGESARLCAAAGEWGTLVWYADAGHGLYDRVETWTDDAARWLLEVLGPFQRSGATRVDPAAEAPTSAPPAVDRRPVD